MSLRRRLALLVAAAVALTVATVSLLAYVTARQSMREQIDETLVDQGNSLIATAQRIEQYHRRTEVVPALQVLGQQLDRDGRVLSQPVLPVTETDTEVAAADRGTTLRDIRLDGEHMRVVTMPLPQPGGGALQMARSLEEVDAALRRLGLVLLIGSAVGIGASAYVGFVVARAGLVPVDRLTSAAEHVGQTRDLGARIEVTGEDEVARLSRTFNEMLAALEESQRRQRQLVEDASHELRTPLTSLRTNIELLARSDADPTRALPDADRRALVRDLTAQLEELSVLVGDVTLLARDGEQPEAAVELDLADVVARAVRRARRRAPGVQFVETTEPTRLTGQPAALERAVTNLLDNAAKWSPPGERVEVTLQAGELAVRDRGPGIADEDLPLVFERFYRSAAARSTPGSGLGLAIVKDAVLAHGGTVSVERDGGTVVRLRFPVAQAVPTSVQPAGQVRPSTS